MGWKGGERNQQTFRVAVVMFVGCVQYSPMKRRKKKKGVPFYCDLFPIRRGSSFGAMQLSVESCVLARCRPTLRSGSPRALVC